MKWHGGRRAETAENERGHFQNRPDVRWTGKPRRPMRGTFMIERRRDDTKLPPAKSGPLTQRLYPFVLSRSDLKKGG